MPWGGLEKPHVVTVGFFDNGKVGEIFISGGKSGELIAAIARDGAILISLALQHGATLDTIAHAITRNSNDEPQTIVGAIIDEVIKEVAK